MVVLLAATANGQHAEEQPPAYDRSLYNHWTDDDGDCQDTRQEVLISESLEPVELDGNGCHVISGSWFDPFTGETITNPSQLDIDHFVPLAEAHRSGAAGWDDSRRERYANDLFHHRALIAVSASANRSKGDRDPAAWLPPRKDHHCEYVREWVLHKATWGLAMDEEERRAVEGVLQGCGEGAKPPEPAPDGEDPSAPPDLATAEPPAEEPAAEDQPPQQRAEEGDPAEEPAVEPAGDEAAPECSDINLADAETLESVYGIGPSKAKAIIEYREQAGGFQSLDELDSVSGIGPATLQGIREANFCVPNTP